MNDSLWKDIDFVSMPYSCDPSPYFSEPSPYFLDGGASCRYPSEYKTPKQKPPKKLELWTCSFCGCANLSERTSCEHCNGPRFLDEQKKSSVAWCVDPASVKTKVVYVPDNTFLEWLDRKLTSIKNQFKVMFRKAS